MLLYTEHFSFYNICKHEPGPGPLYGTLELYTQNQIFYSKSDI